MERHIMNRREQLILNCFDIQIREEIMNYCRRISKMQADVYILMARKASCFFNCLEELGIIHFDGYVTSERVLDMNSEWLHNKKVIILDDAIVSGTTLQTTIRKLEECGVAQILVHVLTINEKWYKAEMLENRDHKNVLVPVYNKLPNSQCIKLCNDVVRSISLMPRPYDIDFPLYKEIELPADSFRDMLSLWNWEYYDITSSEQRENDILNFTIIPNSNQIAMFEEFVNFNFAKNSIIKIRVYGRKKNGNKDNIYIRLAPMIVLDRMAVADVNRIFEIITKNGDTSQNFVSSFNSCAKLRFLQFYFSDKFVKYWCRQMLSIYPTLPKLQFDDRNLSFLFPPNIDYIIRELCQKKTNENLKVVYTNNNDTIPQNSKYRQFDNLSIEARLAEPFIEMYYEKEIPCREKVLLLGKKIFETDEYKNLRSRLNQGVTVSDLCQRIMSFSDIYDVKTRVSLFLDKAIDWGIIVPIIQEKDGIICRAYRHGEDVVFGEREEIMYSHMLLEFQKNSNDQNKLTRIAVEKMIVIFTKIGIHQKFLTPYLGDFSLNAKDDNGKIAKVLRIKTALQGPVAVVADVQELKKNMNKPYITDERKAIWLSNILLENDKITDVSGKICATNSANIDNVENIDDDTLIKIDIFSGLFGEVCNSQVDTGITYGDKELIKVSTCTTMRDVINAISSEMQIFDSFYFFQNNLQYSNVQGDRAIVKRFLNSNAWESINNAKMKSDSYAKGTARNLVESVKFANPFSQKQWVLYFNQQLKMDTSEKDNRLVKIFSDQKLWIYANLLLMTLIKTFLSYNFYIKYHKHFYGKVKPMFELLEEINEQLCIDIKNSESEIARESLTVVSLYKQFIKAIDWENCIERTYFSEINRKIRSYRKYSETLLENVCLLLGRHGKIYSVFPFTHCAYIKYECLPEKDAGAREAILSCFNAMQTLLKDKRLQDKENGQFSEKEETQVLQLPSEYCPHEDRETKCIEIWYIARGEKAEVHLTKMVFDIYMALYYHRITINAILLPDIRFQESVRTNEEKIQFMCNNFYVLVQNLSDEIYQNINQISTLSCIVEDSAYEECRAIDFLDKSSKIEQSGIKNRKIVLPDNDRIYIKNTYIAKEGRKKNRMDIGIITVLIEEASAVKKIFSLQQIPLEMGNRLYFEGRQIVQGKTKNIIMTQTLEQGPTSVISAFTDMMQKYHPDLIFLIGIAGGISEDINYCDVVIASQVICYDLCKDKGTYTQRRGKTYNIEPVLIPVVGAFLHKTKDQTIFSSNNSLNDQIGVHYEPIASGSAVIGSKLSEILAWIRHFNDKTIATEMEANGLCSAVYEAELGQMKPKYGVMIVRGISDMADEKKPEMSKYRIPAAENAALISKNIIELLP